MSRALLERAPVIVLAALLLLFFVVPLGSFLSLAMATHLGPGLIARDPTAANLLRVVADGYIGGVLLTTLRVALCVTILVVALGWPVAHLIARRRGPLRRAVLLIVTASLFTNLVVRTYGWIALLTPRGVVNEALLGAGLIQASLPLMFNEAGVVIGLTQIMLPIFILVTATSIAGVEEVLIEAASVAGAGPLATFLRVMAPLSAGGVARGALLVLVLTLSNFITPDFLGGGRVLMIGSLLHQLITRTLNYPFAAAVAATLLALGLAAFLAFRLAAVLLGRRPEATRA